VDILLKIIKPLLTKGETLPATRLLGIFGEGLQPLLVSFLLCLADLPAIKLLQMLLAKCQARSLKCNLK
jgi:hypothetical protein